MTERTGTWSLSIFEIRIKNMFINFIINTFKENVFLIPEWYQSYENKKYLYGHLQYKTGGSHAAVITGKHKFDFEKQMICNEIVPLIKCFRKIGRSYKVYLQPSKEEFKKIIFSKKIKWIYIFGHGRKNGFRFGKKDILLYRIFKGVQPKKDAVHQYHCGTIGGLSLAHYISNHKDDFVAEGILYPHQSRNYIIGYCRKLEMLHKV